MNEPTLPCCYLAPISYYKLLAHSQKAWMEVCDYYTKQTPRNRCWIDSPSGPLALSIPVVKTESKTQMRDIRISDHGNWRHQHWNALVSSYRQSPFFEFLADDFAPFYERKWTFLADFNEDLMQLVLHLLDLAPHVSRTTSFTLHSDWPPTSTDQPKPYYQMFAHRHGFLPDLSIVDLLFNMGNEAPLYL